MTQTAAATEADVAWVPYVDARSGLAFEHPEDWKVEQGAGGLLGSVVAPHQGVGFAPNLNVVRRVNDHAYTLDDLARAAIREVRRVLTDALLVDLDAAMVAGDPARRLVFTYRQGIYGLTGEQWVWITPGHLWTVTAGATNDGYDGAADVFARVVRTLKVDVS